MVEHFVTNQKAFYTIQNSDSIVAFSFRMFKFAACLINFCHAFFCHRNLPNIENIGSEVNIKRPLHEINLLLKYLIKKR